MPSPCNDDCNGGCLKIPPWGFSLTGTRGSTRKQALLRSHLLSGGSEDAFQRAFLHQNETYLLTGVHLSKGIPDSVCQPPPASPGRVFHALLASCVPALPNPHLHQHPQPPAATSKESWYQTALHNHSPATACIHTYNLEITFPGVTE